MIIDPLIPQGKISGLLPKGAYADAHALLLVSQQIQVDTADLLYGSHKRVCVTKIDPRDIFVLGRFHEQNCGQRRRHISFPISKFGTCKLARFAHHEIEVSIEGANHTKAFFRLLENFQRVLFAIQV